VADLLGLLHILLALLQESVVLAKEEQSRWRVLRQVQCRGQQLPGTAVDSSGSSSAVPNLDYPNTLNRACQSDAGGLAKVRSQAASRAMPGPLWERLTATLTLKPFEGI
jgi:hypothetical protein